MARLTEWMKANASFLGDRPLSQVFLPGAHDAGAYQLSLDVMLSDCLLESWTRRATKALGPLVSSWILTQDRDIAGQLDLGVRFLDFRVSAQNSSQVSLPVLWLTHTVACVPLAEALKQVDSWLTQHPSEAVMMRITCDWEHRNYWQRDEHGTALWQLLQATVGHHLLPSTFESAVGGLLPTYNEVMTTAKPLIVLWELDFPDGPTGDEARQGLWGGPGLTDTLWPDEANPEDNVNGMIRLVAARQQAVGYTPGAGNNSAAPPSPEQSPSPTNSSSGSCGDGKGGGWSLFTRYCYAAYATTPGKNTVKCCWLFGLRLLASISAELLPRLLAIDLTGVPCVAMDYVSEEVVRAVVAHNNL